MKSKLKINQALGGIFNQTWLLALVAMLGVVNAALGQGFGNEFGAGAGNSTLSGFNNTANGMQALSFDTSGRDNTANGFAALYSNTSGNNNTANGYGALSFNTTGNQNTANGWDALNSNTTGNNNIGLGYNAGYWLTTGDNNIDIGNYGVAGEAGVIRIGDPALHSATFIAGITGITVTNTAQPVVIDANGQLGTVDLGTLTGPAGTNGLNGVDGINGTNGVNGTNGADGLGLMPGAFVFLAETAPAPVGFTKIGTRRLDYRDLKNHDRTLAFAIYQRNQPN